MHDIVINFKGFVVDSNDVIDDPYDFLEHIDCFKDSVEYAFEINDVGQATFDDMNTLLGLAVIRLASDRLKRNKNFMSYLLKECGHHLSDVLRSLDGKEDIVLSDAEISALQATHLL